MINSVKPVSLARNLPLAPGAVFQTLSVARAHLEERVELFSFFYPFQILSPPREPATSPAPLDKALAATTRNGNAAGPQRPHAVVVPYPGPGNINPALQLAQLLRRHGVFITFVVTEHNLRRAEAAAEGAARRREGFRRSGSRQSRTGWWTPTGTSRTTTSACARPPPTGARRR